jgi:uracil phosphoribosyltransferase
MTSTKAFRVATAHIGELLVTKVIECLETQAVEVQTPTASCRGEVIAHPIELVSILRSGDALLDTFMSHFPDAHVTKVLVQKNEETAHPVFSYMKLSPSIASGATVLVLDPMIATGDTLHTVLSLLKEKGVQEENIIVACIATCPEGLRELCAHHSAIRLVMNVLDEKLNEKKCIVPGLGDFGDRYYGTPKPQP